MEIKLRKLNKEDAKVFFEWANNPDLIKYVGPCLSVSAEDEYKRISEKKNRLVLVIEAEGKAIGYIYLDIDEKNKKAEFSIAIGEKDCRGKGYGREAAQKALQYAFNELNLNKLFLKVLTFNDPAIRLYERMGFKKEGLLRQDVFLDGEFEDFIIMSILKKEWR